MIDLPRKDGQFESSTCSVWESSWIMNGTQHGGIDEQTWKGTIREKRSHLNHGRSKTWTCGFSSSFKARHQNLIIHMLVYRWIIVYFVIVVSMAVICSYLNTLSSLCALHCRIFVHIYKKEDTQISCAQHILSLSLPGQIQREWSVFDRLMVLCRTDPSWSNVSKDAPVAPWSISRSVNRLGTREMVTSPTEKNASRDDIWRWLWFSCVFLGHLGCS